MLFKHVRVFWVLQRLGCLDVTKYYNIRCMGNHHSRTSGLPTFFVSEFLHLFRPIGLPLPRWPQSKVDFVQANLSLWNSLLSSKGQKTTFSQPRAHFLYCFITNSITVANSFAFKAQTTQPLIFEISHLTKTYTPILNKHRFQLFCQRNINLNSEEFSCTPFTKGIHFKNLPASSPINLAFS